jgi:hypothetical protein
MPPITDPRLALEERHLGQNLATLKNQGNLNPNRPLPKKKALRQAPLPHLLRVQIQILVINDPIFDATTLH